MAVDWCRGDLVHSLAIQQVDPLSLELRGALDVGVVSGSLDMDVDSDSKQSAKVTVVADSPDAGWDGTAALRLVHTVSDATGDLMTEALFTGVVRGCEWDSQGEQCQVSLTLASMLKALDLEVMGSTFSMPSGSHAVATFGQLCGNRARRCDAPGLAEHTYSYNLAFDQDWSVRKVCAYLVGDAGGTLDVSPEGIVEARPYVPIEQRQATFIVDALSPRSPVLGLASGSDASLDVPGRVIVRSEQSNDYAQGAYETGKEYSRESRGYLLDEWHGESQLSPFSSAHAAEVAKQYGTEAVGQREKRQQSLMYRPLCLRDVERLRDSDGISDWAINSGTLDLIAWTWSLDLRRCR